MIDLNALNVAINVRGVREVRRLVRIAWTAITLGALGVAAGIGGVAASPRRALAAGVGVVIAGAGLALVVWAAPSAWNLAISAEARAMFRHLFDMLARGKSGIASVDAGRTYPLRWGRVVPAALYAFRYARRGR